MNIIENIKRIRQEKNITQADISEKLNLAQNNYGKIERGITELTVTRLYEIAKVLEVSANELLDEPIQATDNVKINALEERVLNLEEFISMQRQVLEARTQKLEKAYKTFDTYIFWVLNIVGRFWEWGKVFEDKNGVMLIKMTDEELEKFVEDGIVKYMVEENDWLFNTIVNQWNGDARLALYYNRHKIKIEEERARIRREKKANSV